MMTNSAMNSHEVLSLNQMMKMIPGMTLPGLDAFLSKPKMDSKMEDDEGRETSSSPNSSQSPTSAAYRKSLIRPRTNDGKPIPFRGFSRNPALQLALIEAVHTFKPFGYGNVRSGWLKVQQHMNAHPLMDIFEKDGIRLELSWQLCRDVFGRIVEEWKSCDCYQTKMDGIFIEDKVEIWNRLLSEINAMTMAQSAQDEKKRKRDDELRAGEPSPKGARTEALAAELMENPTIPALSFLQHNMQKPANCAQALVGHATPEANDTSRAHNLGASAGGIEELKLDALRQSLAMFSSGNQLSHLDLSRLPSKVLSQSSLPSPPAAPAATCPLPMQHPPSLQQSPWPGASQEAVPSMIAKDMDKGRNMPEMELLARILVLQERQLDEQRRFQEQSLRQIGALEHLVQTVSVMATETSNLLRLQKMQS